MSLPAVSWRLLLRTAVVLAVVAGTVLRFVATSPLWLDEALSANIASLPLGEIGDALLRDGHPPLYYWLLHGWTAAFGDSDVAVRSLSGVLSVATLPLAWLAGWRLSGRTGAAWAVVVLALSPYAVRYATEARMYALVMFLVLAGYLLVARVLDGPRPWEVGLLAVVVGALLWTHYWSLYLLATTGALLLASWWRHPARRRATTAALASLAVGAASFVPWVPSLLEQAAHTGTPWALPSRPTQILDVTLADLGGGGFAEARLYGIAVVILVLLAAFARPVASGGVELGPGIVPLVRDEIVVICGTLLLGAAAGYASNGAYASRYAAVVVPIVLLAVAVGFTRLRSGWILWGLAAALVAFGAVGAVRNAVVDRTQSGDLAELVLARAESGDVVLVCPDQLGPSIERALRGAETDLTVLPYPTAGDARFVDWRDYEERNALADPVAFADAALERAGSAAVWVVWNGSYRTFDGQCEQLVTHLGARRAGAIVETSGGEFENANLHRFG